MNPIGGIPKTQMALPLTEKLLGTAHIERAQSPQQGPDSFIGMVSSGIGYVNSAQTDAQSQVHEMLTGGDVSKIEVMSSVQKADMSFRMLVQVRNKLMAAYEEINSIRI